MSQISYTKHVNQAAAVPATEQLDASQKANNGGGHSYVVDLWTRVRRFLILGAEGGSYYVGERKMVLDNAKAVREAADTDATTLVKMIVEVSDGGLAPKNDPAIFALAIVVAHSNPEVRKMGYYAINKVCRTSTHLFDFMSAVKALRGSSKGLRKAINRWYQDLAGDKLDLQVTKYRQRNGWTHRDILRVAHVKPWDRRAEKVLSYVIKRDSGKDFGKSLDYTDMPTINQFLQLNEMIAEGADAKMVARYLSASDNRLTWEMLPTELLKSKDIWSALLPKMGLTALIRNLGRMTSVGLFDSDLRTEVKTVVNKLLDEKALKAARLHPLSILIALGVYRSGAGVKGSLTWLPNGNIVVALSKAFYLAFKNVEPTGKNYLVGLDVSGSMSSPISAGNVLSCAQAGAAIATVLKRTEPWTEVLGFSSSLVDLKLRADEQLDDFVQRIGGMRFGSTNPGALIEHATINKLPVDVFVVITDNEVNTGQHPKTALAAYRKKVNPKAKLVVLGMTATEFTIADPTDRNSLDIAGLDASFPQILSAFATDKL